MRVYPAIKSSMTLEGNSLAYVSSNRLNLALHAVNSSVAPQWLCWMLETLISSVVNLLKCSLERETGYGQILLSEVLLGMGLLCLLHSM